MQKTKKMTGLYGGPASRFDAGLLFWKVPNLLLQMKLFTVPTVSKLSLNNSKGNSLIRKAVFTMLLSKLFSVLGYKVCWIIVTANKHKLVRNASNANTCMYVPA